MHLITYSLWLPLKGDCGRSGVRSTPECGAELSLPTADLFGCALISTPEQKSAGAKIVADFKLAAWARSTFAQLRIIWFEKMINNVGDKEILEIMSVIDQVVIQGYMQASLTIQKPHLFKQN